MVRTLLLVTVSLCLAACSPAARSNAGAIIGGISGNGSPAPPSTAPIGLVQPKLMLFGGPGHKVYLGCLSCSEVAYDSVKNPVAPTGHRSPLKASSIP